METFETEIVDISFEGLGVAKHPDGYVVFCPGVIPGERVLIEIIKKQKRFATGRPTEILSPSMHRVDAPCSYQGLGAGKCGGCDWMLSLIHI